jgi:hypothetical protein
MQVPEGDEQTRCRNEHVLGHASVRSETSSHDREQRMILTVVFHRLLARMAVSAAPRTIDRDGVSFLEPRYTFPKFLDPAGILMTKRECAGEAQFFLHDVQIRVTDSRAADPDQYLTGTNLRPGDLTEQGGSPQTLETHCLHFGLLE